MNKIFRVSKLKTKIFAFPNISNCCVQGDKIRFLEQISESDNFSGDESDESDDTESTESSHSTSISDCGVGMNNPVICTVKTKQTKNRVVYV